jgi:hypothetical protein
VADDARRPLGPLAADRGRRWRRCLAPLSGPDGVWRRHWPRLRGRRRDRARPGGAWRRAAGQTPKERPYPCLGRPGRGGALDAARPCRLLLAVTTTMATAIRTTSDPTTRSRRVRRRGSRRRPPRASAWCSPSCWRSPWPRCWCSPSAAAGASADPRRPDGLQVRGGRSATWPAGRRAVGHRCGGSADRGRPGARPGRPGPARHQVGPGGSELRGKPTRRCRWRCTRPPVSGAIRRRGGRCGAEAALGRP